MYRNWVARFVLLATQGVAYANCFTTQECNDVRITFANNCTYRLLFSVASGPGHCTLPSADSKLSELFGQCSNVSEVTSDWTNYDAPLEVFYICFNSYSDCTEAGGSGDISGRYCRPDCPYVGIGNAALSTTTILFLLLDDVTNRSVCLPQEDCLLRTVIPYATTMAVPSSGISLQWQMGACDGFWYAVVVLETVAMLIGTLLVGFCGYQLALRRCSCCKLCCGVRSA